MTDKIIRDLQFMQDAQDYCEGQLAALVALARMHFKSGLPEHWGRNSFQVYYDWSDDRRRSWARGSRRFSVAMYVRCINNKTYNEYSKYANHPQIGSIFCPTWREHVLLTLGHEISHIVHNEFDLSLRDIEKHGPMFQRIYGVFRREYINPVVRAANHASKP